MNIKKDGYSWVDFSSYSVLMFGDKYVARLNNNKHTSGLKSFSLDFSVEHTHYHNHTLNAQGLETAKHMAEKIIAFEYEKIINRARATLDKYEALADGFVEVNKVVTEYDAPYGTTEEVIPRIDSYSNNDNLYLGLDYFDDECNAWLPYTDVTVNVGKLPYLESAIDINNNGDSIIAFLEKKGFGHLTGQSISSGYCSFPVFKFNEDKLKEIDSEKLASYAKAHGQDLCSLDDTINKANELKTTEKGPCAGKDKEIVLGEGR